MNLSAFSNLNYVGFTVEKFTQLYNSNKIKLDLAFQRKENHPLENMQDFISCIFQGHSLGLFSLASTDNASESNKYLLMCREENYDYISIDGNNRTVALSKFINNEFAVRIEAGAKRIYYFSELESKLQRAFLDVKVPAVIYEDASIQKCADIFIGHNSSVKISDQESRNAIICKLSKFIREYEKELRNSYTKYTFTEDNKKRKNDESMLDVLCLQINPSKVTSSETRNYVWKDQSSINFDKRYFKETFNTAMMLLDISECNKTQSRSLFRDFAIVRGILFENYLDDIEKFNTVIFLKYFIKKRMEFMNSRKMYDLSKNENVTYKGLMKKPLDKLYHFYRIAELRTIVKSFFIEVVNKQSKDKVA